jgi:hypothetical protein
MRAFRIAFCSLVVGCFSLLLSAEEWHKTIEGDWQGECQFGSGRQQQAMLEVGPEDSEMRREGTLTFFTDEGRKVNLQMAIFYYESGKKLIMNGYATDQSDIDIATGELKTLWNPQTKSINASGRLRLRRKKDRQFIVAKFVFYGPQVYR